MEGGKRALKKSALKTKKEKIGRTKKTAGKKESGIWRPPFYLTYPVWSDKNTFLGEYESFIQDR